LSRCTRQVPVDRSWHGRCNLALALAMITRIVPTTLYCPERLYRECHRSERGRAEDVKILRTDDLKRHQRKVQSTVVPKRAGARSKTLKPKDET
jgi:hypothetical protein